jgi:predicted RNase H-like HicB family nuclease
MTYLVKLIPEQEGGFSVLVPGLPGCVSQGDSREEALKNVAEAIELYLDVVREMAEEGGTETAQVEVAIA